MKNMKVLYCDRSDIVRKIDVHKTSKSKHCAIHKFQSYVYNRYHDLLMMSMKLIGTAVLKINNADYCCTITGISKSGASNLMQNIDLIEKNETL